MAQIISVFSPKGGVGRTFLATNLAVAFSQKLKGKRTLLLDVDIQLPGDMARLLDLKPSKSPVELLYDLHKDIYSAERIDDYIVEHRLSGLDFLPITLNFKERLIVKTGLLSPLLKDLGKRYEYIIADAGKMFCEPLIALLDQTNLILIVTNPDLLSVYQAKEAIDTLQSLTFPLRMMKVVLNRAESLGGVAWREVKSALPCDIIARIPSEGRIVGSALNHRIPVVMDSPRCRVSQVIKELVDDLLAHHEYFMAHQELAAMIGTFPAAKGGEFLKHEDISSMESVFLKEEAVYKQRRGYEDQLGELKKKVHHRLIQELDLRRLDYVAGDAQRIEDLRRKTIKTITTILTEESGILIASRIEREKLIKEIADEALGLGPLEDLLNEPGISDIMVNNKDNIYVERLGKLEKNVKRFISDEQVRQVIERIIAPLGRRIDESVPMVDARLADGSRVNAIIPPLSLTGPTLTIRKFGRERLTIADMEKYGSISNTMSEFIKACVLSRKNIIVSGGTGSGKTTVLNMLSEFIPDTERIITIEDAAELKLHHQHWIRLESRPPNIEGRGSISVRDLFRNTLRMRPDRIIIGECRGPESLDMLQAMNTGHNGSMTTIHANSTQDVLSRMDSLILMSGIEIPLRAIREMIASAIDIIVHTARLSDGSRKVLQITELAGMIDELHIKLNDIFVFNQVDVNQEGKIVGDFRATGAIPSFLNEIHKRGIPLSEAIFKPPAH